MLNTITIIEDDKTFSGLLKKVIDAQPDMACAGTYYNAASALTQFPENPTDVIIMDIQLPDDNGIQLTSYFRKQFPETYIIMCTSFEDDDTIFGALKAGAHGYIVKLDNPEQIVEAIHEVMHGGAPMSMGIAKKVIQYFSKPDKEQTKLIQLTPKENEILALLAKGSFYKEIADILHIGIDTVKKHCGNIYRKLQVSNRMEAVNVYLGR